jgi:hypothetical protein
MVLKMSVELLVNPFPNPVELDKDLNIIIKDEIKKEIEKGNFTFYTLLRKLDHYLELKENKIAIILGYYTVNTVLSSNKTAEQKKEIIDTVFRQVYSEVSKDEESCEIDTS